MKIINTLKSASFLILGFYFTGLGIFGYQDGEETDYILKTYLFFLGIMLIMGAYFSFVEKPSKKSKIRKQNRRGRKSRSRRRRSNRRRRSRR